MATLGQTRRSDPEYAADPEPSRAPRGAPRPSPSSVPPAVADYRGGQPAADRSERSRPGRRSAGLLPGSRSDRETSPDHRVCSIASPRLLPPSLKVGLLLLRGQGLPPLLPPRHVGWIMTTTKKTLADATKLTTVYRFFVQFGTAGVVNEDILRTHEERVYGQDRQVIDAGDLVVVRHIRDGRRPAVR